MPKIFCSTFLIIFALICSLLPLSGCNSAPTEGFAIYLTKDDVPPDKLAILSHLDIADQPLISREDVITYNVQTHELKLTTEAFKRITDLEVPVRGKSFAVCVDKQIIYCGAFWTPISSMSFDGVTIWKPFDEQGPEIITFELGYPSSSFYNGEDPRNNPKILNSLEQDGKLVRQLATNDINQLPRSMKGYEIYSWLENDQWHFTLITGTNRNKTLAEITSPEDSISETGWVKVTVTGPEALITVLSKIHSQEFIFWLPEMRDSPGSFTPAIQLPPQDILDTVHDFAVQKDLELQIPTP